MTWKVLSTNKLFSSGLFTLKSEKCELPDGRVMPRYYVMDFPDWVNILPITKNGEVILVKQYRHASKREHLEVPGGSMDPSLQESFLEGARREMLEETGYDSKNIVSIGSHFPNPALQSNRMHTFIAFDCEKVQEQNLDEFEDLSLYFCSLEKLKDHLINGDVDHSIMIASISKALQYLADQKMI
jgi:8-oxo-dGTP pyrophosphatase MutT (NUDIX family)